MLSLLLSKLVSCDRLVSGVMLPLIMSNPLQSTYLSVAGSL